MSRSLWKGPFSDLKKIQSINTIDYAFLEQSNAVHKKDEISTPATIYTKKPSIITVWSRRSQILPVQADKKFLVHNGRTFINVKCTQSMCSRKYGEFAVTRKKPSHKLNKRKQLHKNAK